MLGFVKFFLLSVLVSAFVLPAPPFAGLNFFSGVLAQSSSSDSLTPAEERELLEKELADLEQQIETIEQDITKTQKEKDNLKNQIYILRNKIKKLDLQIQQSNAIIGDLRSQISDTRASIDKTVLQVADMREKLSGALRSMYREDKKSKAEIVLASSTLSDFFNNVAALEALQARLRELLENMEELNAYLESQKNALEAEKAGEENFVKIQILQKQESQNAESQTEYLLGVTQGKESEYQQLLVDRQRQAQEIRSRIFELIGVPEAPTFGEAVEIAQAVFKLTGVRPAFLLAILTQESNIGKNVGQCYLKDPATGDGVVIRTGKAVSKVMKPSRDVQPFLQITEALGRDPYFTPVSCPIPSVGGYGGAMGPAQFIPSTWMLYKDEIDGKLGRPGNPWDIKDAFLAAAVYLADYGAANQTYNAEWKSAMIYFSGSTNTRYRFYGDSVMAIAKQYEKDIAALQNQ